MVRLALSNTFSNPELVSTALLRKSSASARDPIEQTMQQRSSSAAAKYDRAVVANRVTAYLLQQV